MCNKRVKKGSVIKNLYSYVTFGFDDYMELYVPSFDYII